VKSDSKNATINKLPPPFFIMGCPRSGTTLVAQILDSHSRVAVYLETNYYPLFRPDLDWYGDLRQASNLNRLTTNLLEAIRVQGVTPPEIEEFQKALVAPNFEGVLTTLLHLYARQQGKIRSGEKTPMHYRYLSEILEKFPQSPVIFLMRDPRDTVRSMQKAFSQSVASATRTWNEAYLHYSQSSRPVHLVRYEDLVQEPFRVVKEMCALLGEPYEPTMFRFYERIPEYLRAITHIDLSKLSSPVAASSIGKFREMPADDIKQIEATCAVGMEAMDYPVTTSLAKVAVETVPKEPNCLCFLLDRLRYYRLNRERWRRAWSRWRMMLQLRVHYLLTLGPLRNRH